MYKPLPNYLIIKPSEIHGLGIFTIDNIDKNHILGITHIYDVRFPDCYIRTPLGGFINHSESPNVEFYVDGDFLKIRALRNILSGEEITGKYILYNPI